VATVAARAPGASRERARWPAIAVGASGGVATGPMPGPAPLGSVGAALAWSRVRAELRLARCEATAATATGAGGRFALTTGAARVSVQLAGPLWAEIGVEAGRMTARGRDVDEALIASGPYLAAPAGLTARWRLGDRAAVAVTAEAVVPLRADRFVVIDARGRAEPVHDGDSLGGRVGIALEWRVFDPDPGAARH
jgi:hypothetical protein